MMYVLLRKDQNTARSNKPNGMVTVAIGVGNNGNQCLIVGACVCVRALRKNSYINSNTKPRFEKFCMCNPRQILLCERIMLMCAHCL